MKRLLLNLLTLLSLLSLLSLLLCVAVAVLWVASYRRPLYVAREKLTTGGAAADRVWVHRAVITRGRIRFEAVERLPSGRLPSGYAPAPPARERPWRAYWGWGVLRSGDIAAWQPPAKSLFNRLGFHRLDQRARYTVWPDDHFTGVMVPAWLCAALLAAPPLAWFRRQVRDRRRHKKGLCPACGYDLRATPDKCPECGHAPAANA